MPTGGQEGRGWMWGEGKVGKEAPQLHLILITSQWAHFYMSLKYGFGGWVFTRVLKETNIQIIATVVKYLNKLGGVLKHVKWLFLLLSAAFVKACTGISKTGQVGSI